MPRTTPLASASRRRLGATALCAVAIAALLVGCAPGSDDAAEPDPSASASAQPSAAPTSTAPRLHPEGTAEENLPLFAAVTAQVWAGEERASSRAYVDALVAAGFDRATMQVTDDKTTVGHPVESLQFSVRWGDAQCLVGQVGPSTGEPVTAVLDQLAEGRCLVGATQPIDW